MSSVIHIDPAGRRAMDRDYLDVERQGERVQRVATVVNFTSRLEQGACFICEQRGHRASSCPQRRKSK